MGAEEAVQRVLEAIGDPRPIPRGDCIRGAADAIEPDLRRTWLRIVNRARANLTEAGLRRALDQIKRFGLVATAELLPLEWEDGWVTPLTQAVVPLIREALERAGACALARIDAPFRFDLVNPRAVQYIRDHGATLVREVVEETKRALRTVIAQDFEAGLHPRQMARRIRPLIGLTERQSLAVLHYWEKLAGDGTLTLDQIERRAKRYAEKLHRERALTIARTEAIDASSAGQEEAWQQAMERGYLDPDSEMEWIATTGDERTCPICSELNGQRVPFATGEFRSSYVGTIRRPPAHPRCRCTRAVRRPRTRRA